MPNMGGYEGKSTRTQGYTENQTHEKSGLFAENRFNIYPLQEINAEFNSQSAPG